MKKEIIAIDYFCGVGGLTRGLLDAGINVVKGIDIDETIKESYVKNNNGVIFQQADMRKLTPKEAMKSVKRKGKLLMFAGCAPCQPFSNLGKITKRDRRKSQILNMGRLIDEIVPEFVLVENVPGFRREDNIYRKEFLKILVKNGYSYDEDVINAANYGVPQIRKRYLLVASRLSEIKLPIKTHGVGNKKFVTVADVIKKYPPIRAGKNHSLVPNHSARGLEKINLERIKLIPKNGGSRKHLPKRLTLNCHKKHGSHTDVYGRMWWNRPAPTLTCRCNSLSNGRFGHPSQNRAISIREAAALQTFRDAYIFDEHDTVAARHIGNAVPVLLAKKLGQAIIRNEGPK